MKKNYVFAGLIVVLGLFTCLIAINPGLVGGGSTAAMSDNIGENSSDTEKNPVAGKILDFSTEDFNGNKIDNSIFKEKKITMINLWATFCGPCIEEIPELQKISEEYKEKINVIGVLTDSEEIETAKEILKTKKISYKNIIVDSNLNKQIVNHFDYIPVTLLVNEEGKVLEKFIPGSTDYEGFKKLIEGVLE